jgi:lysophospholipase L1-like esterase
MLAFWLGWHTWKRLHESSSGWPLATGAIVVLFKRVDLSPALLLLLTVMLITAAVQAYPTYRGRSSSRRSRWGWLTALWLGWTVFAVQWHVATRCNHPVPFDAARPVACLGDSLTSGVPPDGGYPAELAKLVSVPVLDFGRPGIATDQALRLLPELQAAKPQAVVVELGGHDFLKGRSRAATRANLENILAAAREIGAEVVLVEIPRGFMTDPFAGLERELAREHDLELVSDSVIRQLVLWSPHAPPGMWTQGPYLSDDGLHPNSHGNRHLARHIAAALARLYGAQVLATGKPSSHAGKDRAVAR